MRIVNKIIIRLVQNHWCDILCIQETHRAANNNRPNIQGMQIIIERPHKKHGSAILAKPNLEIMSSDHTEQSDIEILTIELKNCTVNSI